MADRLLLIDSDMFILLAGAEMLDRTIELLGFHADQCRRFPALESQLRRGKTFLEKYSQTIRGRALAACERIVALRERPEDDDLLESLNIEGIETEGLMYALLAEQPLSYLASGDKRAMIALATEPSLADVRKTVAGRVICLETVVALLLDSEGIETVAQAFSPLRTANATLRVVFSQAAATPEAQCREYLKIYLRDLTKQVGPGFLYAP